MATLYRIVIVTLAINALAGSATVAQSRTDGTIDCSVDGKQLSCSRAELLRRFAEARTTTLRSEPNDRTANAQLTSFARLLGKDVVNAPPADLILQIVRTPAVGVAIGPSDVDRATLRVFASDKAAGTSRLLWVETYRGQLDVPWGAVVRSLTNQLQSTLSGR